MPRAEEGQLSDEDRRPAAWTVDRKIAAERLGAIAQALQSGAIPERRSTGAIVDHGEAEPIACACHFDPDVVRGGVLHGVCRRLSGDEVSR